MKALNWREELKETTDKYIKLGATLESIGRTPGEIKQAFRESAMPGYGAPGERKGAIDAQIEMAEAQFNRVFQTAKKQAGRTGEAEFGLTIAQLGTLNAAEARINDPEKFKNAKPAFDDLTNNLRRGATLLAENQDKFWATLQQKITQDPESIHEINDNTFRKAIGEIANQPYQPVPYRPQPRVAIPIDLARTTGGAPLTTYKASIENQPEKGAADALALATYFITKYPGTPQPEDDIRIERMLYDNTIRNPEITQKLETIQAQLEPFIPPANAIPEQKQLWADTVKETIAKVAELEQSNSNSKETTNEITR